MIKLQTQHVQLSTAYHVTQDQNIAIDRQPEIFLPQRTGKNLFTCLWTCIFPSFNASVHTFGKVNKLGDIKPSGVWAISFWEISYREIYFQRFRL